MNFMDIAQRRMQGNPQQQQGGPGMPQMDPNQMGMGQPPQMGMDQGGTPPFIQGIMQMMQQPPMGQAMDQISQLGQPPMDGSMQPGIPDDMINAVKRRHTLDQIPDPHIASMGIQYGVIPGDNFLQRMRRGNGNGGGFGSPYGG